MKRFQLSILIALLSVSAVSKADLAVDETIIVFGDEAKTKHDLTVYNTDETSVMYLEVTPHKVVNPGEESESLEPMSLDSAPEFLVSPNRAIVAPGSPSLIRLLDLKNESLEERIYRINLIPASPPLELQQEDEDVVASALQVVVAYQVLVIVLPANPKAEMTTTRIENAVSFANTGNANYLLTNGEQCDPNDPNNCVALSSRRVYPGNNWTLDLPYDGPASYTVRKPNEASSVLVF